MNVRPDDGPDVHHVARAVDVDADRTATGDTAFLDGTPCRLDDINGS
jgi:hypothetical protein